jgi:hypothetical protein
LNELSLIPINELGNPSFSKKIQIRSKFIYYLFNVSVTTVSTNGSTAVESAGETTVVESTVDGVVNVEFSESVLLSLPQAVKAPAIARMARNFFIVLLFLF